MRRGRTGVTSPAAKTKKCPKAPTSTGWGLLFMPKAPAGTVTGSAPPPQGHPRTSRRQPGFPGVSRRRSGSQWASDRPQGTSKRHPPSLAATRQPSTTKATSLPHPPKNQLNHSTNAPLTSSATTICQTTLLLPSSHAIQVSRNIDNIHFRFTPKLTYIRRLLRRINERK